MSMRSRKSNARTELATIDSDLLDVERQLAALTWQMRRDGSKIEFSKITPAAILGVAFAPRQPRRRHDRANRLTR